MRPYIICHMIESVDGRIDCSMTEKIDDTDHYYEVLDKLDCPSSLEGKVTLEMHYADGNNFEPQNSSDKAGAMTFKTKQSGGYAVGVDTKGTLLWGNNTEELFGKPLIMLLSENASKEYTEYLKSKNISFICIGEGKIDLPKAMEILRAEFGIERLAVTGGGHINGSMLEAGLIDEISMMYASGIDARGGMAASFDGRSHEKEPIRLNLKNVEVLDDIIWARYTIRK